MVNSTVPRLDERCPPVADTDSTKKLRNSPASFGSALRSSMRNSEGKLIVSSSGYILILKIKNMASKLSLNDEISYLT